VVVVSKANEPVAMLVCRLEDECIAPSIGYFKPLQIRVRSLSIVYSGLLGQVDQTVSEMLTASLRESLRKRESDVVTLYQLPERSPLLVTAMEQTSRLWRDTRPSLSLHWQLDLYNKTGGLLQMIGSKHRGVTRRRARDLEKAYPGRVSCEEFQLNGDIGKLCEDLESVARLTYHRGLGEGFKDDTDHRERFTLFNRMGALRAWILRIDGTPRAFCVGFTYRDVFHFFETGYDPGFRSHGIGMFLFLHMTDALIKEGLRKFDYGFGDAEYKQRFSDRSWQEATLRIYARSPTGFFARWYTGFATSFSNVVRLIVRKLGILERLKTAWRSRLSATTEKDASSV